MSMPKWPECSVKIVPNCMRNVHSVMEYLTTFHNWWRCDLSSEENIIYHSMYKRKNKTVEKLIKTNKQTNQIKTCFVRLLKINKIKVHFDAFESTNSFVINHMIAKVYFCGQTQFHQNIFFFPSFRLLFASFSTPFSICLLICICLLSN